MDEQVYVYVDLNGTSAFNHGDLQKATRIRQFEETEATAEIARSAWNRKVCAKGFANRFAKNIHLTHIGVQRILLIMLFASANSCCCLVRLRLVERDVCAST